MQPYWLRNIAYELIFYMAAALEFNDQTLHGDSDLLESQNLKTLHAFIITEVLKKTSEIKKEFKVAKELRFTSVYEKYTSKAFYEYSKGL